MTVGGTSCQRGENSGHGLHGGLESDPGWGQDGWVAYLLEAVQSTLTTTSFIKPLD